MLAKIFKWFFILAPFVYFDLVLDASVKRYSKENDTLKIIKTKEGIAENYKRRISQFLN